MSMYPAKPGPFFITSHEGLPNIGKMTYNLGHKLLALV